MAGVRVAGAKGALAGGRGCSPARTRGRPGADSRRRARAGPGSSQWVLPGISPLALWLSTTTLSEGCGRIVCGCVDVWMWMCVRECAFNSFTQPTTRRRRRRRYCRCRECRCRRHYDQKNSRRRRFITRTNQSQARQNHSCHYHRRLRPPRANDTDDVFGTTPAARLAPASRSWWPSWSKPNLRHAWCVTSHARSLRIVVVQQVGVVSCRVCTYSAVQCSAGAAQPSPDEAARTHAHAQAGAAACMKAPPSAGLLCRCRCRRGRPCAPAASTHIPQAHHREGARST